MQVAGSMLDARPKPRANFIGTVDGVNPALHIMRNIP